MPQTDNLVVDQSHTSPIHFIHTEEIQVSPSRQRQHHDPLKHNELMESIWRSAAGLQNPIVLRRDGTAFHLVSGERRLRAIKDIYSLGGRFYFNNQLVSPNFIPYVFVGDLDELAAEEAEWDENFKRDDLTWQEAALATARLESLRAKQAARDGVARPTTADLAEELRGNRNAQSQDTTRRELIVARNLDKPGVAAAKTLDEAFKTLKRAEQTAQNVEVAKAVGGTLVSERHIALFGNCLSIMETLPEHSFDVILTDPPYGMGADEFGDSGGAAVGPHAYTDSEESFYLLTDAALPAITHLAKLESHLYMFCDIDKFNYLKSQLTLFGWKVFRTPLIWVKPSAFRAPWPNQGPQRKYELILYAVRGDKPCTKLLGDVLTYPPDTNLGHSAQKPVALLQDLLARSAVPGDRVLDPFCGTGGIFPAANALSILATGIEQDESAFGITCKRIEGLK